MTCAARNSTLRSLALCGLVALFCLRCGDDGSDADPASEAGAGGDEAEARGGSAGEAEAHGGAAGAPDEGPGGGSTGEAGGGGLAGAAGGAPASAGAAGQPDAGSAGMGGSDSSDCSRCNAGICLDGVCVQHGTGSGKSCADPLIITRDMVIEGASFSADFGDEHDVAGEGCELGGESTPDAIFAVKVPAQGSVLLREVADDPIGEDADTSIDAVLGLVRSCADAAECVASRGSERWENWSGTLYTAEADETLFAYFGARERPSGRYGLSIEYPKHLGSFGPGETLPVVTGEQLRQNEWETHVIDATEPLYLYGTLSGFPGDVDVTAIYTPEGPIGFSRANGQDTFAFPVLESRYLVQIGAFNEVERYTLRLFTDPILQTATLNVGEDFTDAPPDPIAASRSVFYRFEVGEPMQVTVSVRASSGDPDIYLYYDTGRLARFNVGLGQLESFVVDLPDPGMRFGMRVLAHEDAVDIDSYEVTLSPVELPVQ